MASVVEIWNLALISLGVDRVLDPLEESEGARKCAAVYPILRDDELSSHPWNFAINRKSLALTPDEPEYGFASSFQLPSDCLRVIELFPKYEYKVEGDRLLTNSGDASVMYIRQVTDPNAMPPYFRNLLSSRIRYELAYSLTDSATAIERFFALYETIRNKAKAIDAQEGTPTNLFSDRWINARAGNVR